MKRRPFTLLELFFCVGILAVISSLLVFKARPMIFQYQFQAAVSDLRREMEWSYHIATSTSADIDFTIEKRGETLFCRRHTDEPLKLAGRNRSFKISHIPDFTFIPKKQAEKNTRDLKVTFFRTGSIFPEGTLKLSSSKECFEIELDPSKHSTIVCKRHLF
jgi:hypothetical protein